MLMLSGGLVLLVLASVAAWCWAMMRYRQALGTLRQQNEALAAARRKIDALKSRDRERTEQFEGTEKKLRRYLKLLDTLINTIPNPIFYKDANGVYRGCNRSFSKEILGLTRDRIIGRRAQGLTAQIPADLAAVYRREELRMADKQGVHTFEAQVPCADGKMRDFLFTMAAVYGRDGNFQGSVGMMLDLTERNRAAAERLEKEKLEGVLETAGAVCHEFNQPLQALSGFAELVLAIKTVDEQTADMLDQIQIQVRRMVQLTDKLQQITRVETMDYADQTRIIDIHKSSQG